jgi:hypothetical protein
MSATLAGALTISGNLQPSGEQGLIAAISAICEFRLASTLTDGTGANQIHQGIAVSGALAASATATHKLNDGVATDPYGNLLAVTKLKMLVILNTSATAAVISLTNTNAYAVNNTAATKQYIAPGGALVVFNPTAAGFATVGDNTGTLLITNESGALAATYKLYAAGSGA